ALVTNVGLSELIALSVPVLYTIYPVAIALVALTFCSNFLANKPLSYRFVLAVSFLFSILDGIKAAGVNLDMFSFIPFFNIGMAWVIPTTGALIIALFVFKENPQEATQTA
ncbi:MAG: branched-chain amino acid transport system II carrier protein, partial [Psychromonas sp.]